MTTASIEKIIKDSFSEKRRVHTYGVVKVAQELANIYGVDAEKARIAALYHDLFRGVDIDVINYYVNLLNLDQKYLNNANLAHGKIAAHVMSSTYGVEDQGIIDAVSYHTTGRANMTTLEKVIFIADAIEPSRDYPGVNYLRELAYSDLDKACLHSLDETIKFVSGKGNYLDPDTIKARNFLLEKEI